MNAARWPRPEPKDDRLLVIDPARSRYEDLAVRDLPSLLRAGDAVIVNDVATLPASLRARVHGGSPLEVRLLQVHDDRRATAVLFGSGDWREDTDTRAPPPLLRPGARLRFDDDTEAEVRSLSRLSPRLLELQLPRGARWSRVAYAHGAPVQYSYLKGALPISLAQTPYASRPWAVEMPSAGRPLSTSLLTALRARGVAIARLSHAAGLSATGDAELDAHLPLPERYELPAETVDVIERARGGGGRVIAVGTTVTRALEGAFMSHGRLRPGAGVTDLVLDERFVPRVVTGVLSGMHERGTSHARLLGAVAPSDLLEAALAHAEEERYLVHEFGDHLLILPGALDAARPAA